MFVSGRWEKDARLINLSRPFNQSEWVVLEAAMLAAQIAQRRRIVLNFAEISSSDRSIIGQFLLTAHLIKPDGVQLSVVLPKPLVRENLSSINGSSSLAIYHSEEEKGLKPKEEGPLPSAAATNRLAGSVA